MPEHRSVFDRIRGARFTPGTLLLILAILVGLFVLFAYTDLWYVLFP